MKSITTTGEHVVEDVKLLYPCPDGICDGSGNMYDEETGTHSTCPHVKDPWAVEPNQ